MRRKNPSFGFDDPIEEQETVTIDNDIELTLYTAIEQIVQVVEGTPYGPEVYEIAARPIAYLSNRLSLTELQSVLFAGVINRYYDKRIGLLDIARWLDLSPLAAISLLDDIEHLCKLRYLRYRLEDRDTIYWVPANVIEAVRHNTDISTSHYVVPDDTSWFQELDNIFESYCDNDMDYNMLCDEVQFLAQDNPELHFVQQMTKQCADLDRDSRMLFLWSCSMLVTTQTQQITPPSFRNLFKNIITHRSHCVALANGSHKLLTKGLLRVSCEGGINIKDTYELTPMVVNDMLTGLVTDFEEQVPKGVILHSSIIEKAMFYNPTEKQQVERLTNLLQQEHFTEVRNRLRERGFRSGFACLFYGAPGTGKTETVLQLARATGRNLVEVNVAEIKSKWVGESEKNIKEVFNNYRAMLAHSEIAPILFFNEADAIFGKRLTGISRSVDKMENSLQNIILEELEHLDGIVIATTNLTCNFDKAFERRFLYKIEFKQPSVAAKTSIWKSMIPELSELNARMLAEKYNFSGGQIENIARKRVVDMILSNEEFSLDALCNHCNSEIISRSVKPRRQIGF